MVDIDGKRVAEPVLGGLFSADTTRLSADACLPRMQAMEKRSGSVFNGIQQAQAERASGKRPAVSVYALRDGMGSIIDALVDFRSAGNPA